MIDYSREGIEKGRKPPDPLPEGFSWGRAYELGPNSNLAASGYHCPCCRQKLRTEEYIRPLNGPRGPNYYHDDCTDARDFSTRLERVQAKLNNIEGDDEATRTERIRQTLAAADADRQAPRPGAQVTIEKEDGGSKTVEFYG